MFKAFKLTAALTTLAFDIAIRRDPNLLYDINFYRFFTFTDRIIVVLYLYLSLSRFTEMIT